MQRHLSVFNLPAGNDQAIHAVQGSLRIGHSTAGMRLDEDVLVASLTLIDFDSSRDAVEPLANCPIGIVIEGIHRGTLESSIGLDSVPALPDCRGALQN